MEAHLPSPPSTFGRFVPFLIERVQTVSRCNQNPEHPAMLSWPPAGKEGVMLHTVGDWFVKPVRGVEGVQPRAARLT